MTNPSYEITASILKLISSISEKIGQIKSEFVDRPKPRLRKENRIKTIHASLQIEGNTLTEDQITALLENKRVLGPQRDVIEVVNAIKVYKRLKELNPLQEKSFLKGQKIVMKGLVEKPGQYRTQGVGVVQGSKVEHLAAPHENVPFLMKDIFEYLNESPELELIKSCVFHYEVEFIHPFKDGNGRMGRLWQTLILMKEYPLFEFLPFETLISQEQNKYYEALSKSDKSGSSTPFIEYMLGVIDDSLKELLTFKNRTLNTQDRLLYFVSLGQTQFSRKDYMSIFKNISTATASRDLKKGIELGLFQSEGDHNKTFYRLIN